MGQPLTRAAILAAVFAARLTGADCIECHRDVWETYRHSGMARSFYRPTPANMPVIDPQGSVYFHKASNTYFVMLERDGRYFQRQYQLDFDGKHTAPFEKQIDYVMGSGNHVRTFLHRTERNTLIELPLAWYAEKGAVWAMNPGYDRPDHQGFRRNIAYDCMFCHNAYPGIPAAHARPRSAPVYTNLPEGIDCARCHGSGEQHSALARKGAPVDEIRNAIVNPRRLTADRQMEVCMQCHLETTSSPLPAYIVRYERGPFSYDAGERLSAFMLHFDQARGKGYDDKFEIDGSAYRLRQSRCFRESAGKLTCITCHDPHGSASAAQYTAICEQCHAPQLETLMAKGRHTREADCIGCHMPKRHTDDVVHAVMTDHLIQRQSPSRERQDEPYRGPVKLYYPAALPKPEDELYLAIAQVSQNSNLPDGIERLSSAIEKFRPKQAEYYLQLGDAWSAAGNLDRALRAYEEALEREPGSVVALERLGLCLAASKQNARAETVLKRAVDLTPDAPAWTQLALIGQQQGRSSDAESSLRKALQLDPDMVEAYNSLGSLLLGRGDTVEAEKALRNAIRVDPNYAPAHNNLANFLASAGRFDEAVYHYEAALRSRPSFNGARFNYAVTLVRMHRVDDARAQLQMVLRADPNDDAAKELLRKLDAPVAR